ncbi:HEPN domain-containing protein [Desulfovibrio litoralis]|uniref:RiboL-PSP-HEPN domain-containing protein n=1 Tax=Desulfovibrio litoralis DSM 11393 TaxID=1121455 RepID=A0A1M7TCU9_9BACT|nr:HEPN domain-containing protein [Desulfovibrio litoralis]SHN68579.1 hypothetical protein SAMN02745728_01855 [Desulfovibrio litoralis DSM 11393]
MATNTKYFFDLKKRIQFLRTTLLPTSLVSNLSGRFNSEEKDKISSFCLLTHAELEHYFESIAVSVLDKCLKEWEMRKRITHCLGYLLKADISPLQEDRQLSALISEVCHRKKGGLQGNHGIKKDDIKRIYNDLGCYKDFFGDSFLNDLDLYGKLRGDHAHKSARIRTQISPTDLITKIHNILAEIEVFDKKIKIDMNKK